MAWNEPGKDKDPWGSRNNNDGPPDLDEAFKKLQDKLNGMFGGGGGSKRGSGGSGFGFMAVIALIIAAVFYVAVGVYQVDAKERAVVLRFGAFADIKGEGLNWRWPLIEQVIIVNTTSARQYSSKGLMLTEDESIVELPLTVQYNVADVKAFALNVRDPETSLRHATDSAVRHVVGSSELNQVLSEGRQAIAAEVQRRLQAYLEAYGAGINVMNVNIQEARPPQEVRAAFDDVIKAKEDESRLKSQAQAYSNAVIPEARGRAQRMMEEAEAYRAEVIARAEGETDRFENLLAEYKRAPEVTRERLYLDAVESVMGSASKVMVDVKGGNNMIYLPLDRMGGARSVKSVDSSPAPLDPYNTRSMQPAETLVSPSVRREVR
ncbi:FtsH protease activity modulator HflK [Cellvibrio japonicus]|uniref:Protein HflK n=1 Tax=Cellvibrio japonicus (strain Ueda107) TaxID=498211 RepID=B3PDB9_CELJU|nr:FtsH protease activity modulator HflK [Cellvibrio japonicus]ACE84254.1 HflK protein [Cellvibrio japonicus Ueda107]QEI13372.1 FtsH protease activity modulator HflK [Cellvibrio japonicus]QEI16946.1 FtsH protease activity modulator HflK [Cellvibrio japonicus]QEI20524.1 FtsH protease activity modulator HflK [Cellvibrio japonicus]